MHNKIFELVSAQHIRALIEFQFNLHAGLVRFGMASGIQGRWGGGTFISAAEKIISKKRGFFVALFFVMQRSSQQLVFYAQKITYTIDYQADRSIVFACHLVHCRSIEVLFAMDFHAIPKYECEIICQFHLAKHAANCCSAAALCSI